uniref:Uncharacterized protein n=1 Tax=Meloidogyne enterolobii TaxID=390850 RepID=A0A6V7WXT4_MELEN|nr:unnamed protein product [Meloidogyne enterolobii]
MIPHKVIILLLFMVEINQVINSKLINRKKHKVIETEHDFKLNKAVNSITKDNRKLDVIDTEAALNQVIPLNEIKNKMEIKNWIEKQEKNIFWTFC